MSSKKTYAPIILFTYRRHNILKKVIKNLELNKLSKYSEIYIFSDGYKNFNDKKDVLKVRKYLKTIKFFKNKKIFLRNKNMGLTKNIILGITKVLSIKKKAIILEDDILVSENFLKFMNLCLDKYKNKKKIWHINGWNYNLKETHSSDDVFFGEVCIVGDGQHGRIDGKNLRENPKKLMKVLKKRISINSIMMVPIIFGDK